MARAQRLLSVDWDFFTVTEGSALERKHPLVFDWGHSETWGDRMEHVLWAHRAAMFQLKGLPLPVTSGVETRFWERFTFAPKTRLFLMNSHRFAARPELFQFHRYREVWNFDAHHDCGYGDTSRFSVETVGADAGNWMLAYHLLHRSRLFVRYPTWKEFAFSHEKGPSDVTVDRAFDNGAVDPVRFDDVVVARSDSWTPPWLDAQFFAFVDACPIPANRRFVTPPGSSLTPRPWEPADVDAMVVDWKKLEEGRRGYERTA